MYTTVIVNIPDEKPHKTLEYMTDYFTFHRFNQNKYFKYLNFNLLIIFLLLIVFNFYLPYIFHIIYT